MKLDGERIIAAEPSLVWAALLDKDVLQASVPGCQDMSGDASSGFEATVVQKVGPVKATFKGQVTLEDVKQQKSLRLVGSGKGGAAGFAKGAADVAIEAVDDGTKLTYVVDAKVGGKLAQLGARVIDGFAKKMADEFFTRFQAAVEHEDGTEPSVDAIREKGWFRRVFSGSK